MPGTVSRLPDDILAIREGDVDVEPLLGQDGLVAAGHRHEHRIGYGSHPAPSVRDRTQKSISTSMVMGLVPI